MYIYFKNRDFPILSGILGLAIILGFFWIYLLKKFTKLFI